MKEVKHFVCEVCGTELNINKKNVYVADVKNHLWSAVDCTHCGCQTLLKRRYEKVIKFFV